ncbi:MAG: 50S ribosomal protein L9 [Gammaproteobacteria bacterium]|nr:50S ribosomal protein L9 [Gammaproteobacteria bacterium]
MQVILKEKIGNLGNLGDVISVKAGFARNFLLPQGKAMSANKANMATFETYRAELEKASNERLLEAQGRAAKLENLTVTIKASAGEGGKLFGSIGTRDVADAISAQAGTAIAKHEVRLSQGSIRQVGEYEIGLGLHADVATTVKVLVISE